MLINHSSGVVLDVIMAVEMLVSKFIVDCDGFVSTRVIFTGF